ncbi:putative nuclease HARBI1 [Megalops cyprinoides]|uniref:putative nuclease HARBI1 n=1 Tax=Megalops cyprinoides TaxID=118141 RepID=UPI001864A5B0|nr:putative nuclease HARBI1 [Megalops cyprinoides]
MADLAVAFALAEEIDAIEIPFVLHALQERRQRRDIPKIQGSFVKEVVFHYTPSVFRTHFRLSPGLVEDLIRDLHPYYSNIAGTKWPLKDAMLACLWTLGNLESYRSVAERFNTSKSNLSNHLHDICNLIVTHCNHKISWPTGPAVWQIEQVFRNAGFPRTLAAVDACHIRIVKPRNADCPDAYFNSKHFHSVNLTAFTDHSTRFVHINVGHPGSWHDAQVYAQTEVARLLDESPESLLSEGMHLIGDSAYPLSEHLMTPFRDNGHLTRAQKRYNRRLSAARMVVERAFGFLKSRFRRLRGLHMRSIKNSGLAITACCILHNMCLEAAEENFELSEESEKDKIDEELLEQLPPHHPGVQKRNAICASF